jgi:hypothetical protein
LKQGWARARELHSKGISGVLDAWERQAEEKIEEARLASSTARCRRRSPEAGVQAAEAAQAAAQLRGGAPNTRGTPQPARAEDLPAAPSITIYEGAQHGGDRLAECAWLVGTAPELGAFADQWVSLEERASMPAGLGVIVTYVSLRGRWWPRTVATEAATRPGEWGYFPATRLSHGHGGTEALIGAMLDATEPTGPSRYLIEINSRLRDGAGCRPGGPRTANDCKGTGLHPNVYMWSHGYMWVRPHFSIEPLQPGLPPHQRRKRELLWDYTKCYWRGTQRAEDAGTLPPIGQAASAQLLPPPMPPPPPPPVQPPPPPQVAVPQVALAAQAAAPSGLTREQLQAGGIHTWPQTRDLQSTL